MDYFGVLEAEIQKHVFCCVVIDKSDILSTADLLNTI